jgi:hypothetical protein
VGRKFQRVGRNHFIAPAAFQIHQASECPKRRNKAIAPYKEFPLRLQPRSELLEFFHLAPQV